MISLLIPFGSNDKRRREIFLWVLARWQCLHPDLEICLGSSDLDNFNRSEARNRAFDMSTGDLLVISDADTFTTPDNVEAAIQMVEAGVPWVIAHHTYYSLAEPFTDQLLHGPPDVAMHPSIWVSNWKMVQKSQAGVLVMPRDAFERAGGYDERFQGWGYEDNAFAVRLDREWGQNERTSGNMFHLWHDPGENFSQPHIKENERLLEETKNAV